MKWQAAKALVVLMLVACQGTAGTLYGVGDFGELYVIDIDTATTTFLGDTVGGNTTLRGLTFGPQGALYACDNNGCLMTIDIPTATGTWVAPCPGVTGISNLTYNASDGYFYAAQSSHSPSHLYRLDAATGAATEVGEIDYTGTGFGYTSGLAYDPISEMLFAASSTGASKLYLMDPQTAGTTLLGDIGFSYTNGLAYAPDLGLLFAAVDPYWTADLTTIDPSTGVGTLVGTTGVGIFGIAYVVPEPSTLILLLLGAAGLGAYAWRRKR